MARTSVALGVGVLAMLASMVFGCGPQVHVAPAPFATSLQPGDAIETLSVILAVSDLGAALDEPIALDLGLGYPLWLHPVGREEGDVVPFGAAAQSSTGGTTIEPGGKATFTFDVAAAGGQDELLTTRHLLAATRVGDVRRIGFASERASDWILGDYEIRINGTLLHVDRAAPRRLDTAQTTASTRIAAIDRELADLATQYEALAAPDGADEAAAAAIQSKAHPLLDERELEMAKVPVDPRSARGTRAVDEERLARLQTAAAASDSAGDAKTDAEMDGLEARRAGTRPWYVAGGFHPTWIPAGSVRTAAVTVETRAHAGADTLNPVYLRVGGHKYALNEQYESLSATSGAQTFDLDLAAGPLAATDLGGWALGMLGAPEARESVPDRWHAQRVVVTVDGKVVYDSDDDAGDRRSLDAVRLIPPAHRDASGAVVTNAGSVREVYLWEAGRGAGLDAAGTSATPLPAATDPTYPQPEAGLTPSASASADAGSWPNSAFPPLPGEQAPSYGTGSGPWLQGGFQWGSGGGSLWGGFGGPGGGGYGQGQGWKLPWGSGSGSSGKGAPGGSSSSGKQGGSTTTGKPFQMQEVWISSGWKLNEPFTVEWKVSGDTSGIRHFLVSVRVVRPDQSQGVFKDVVKKPVKVAVGQRSCTVLVDPKFQPKQPYYYLAPYVTAVTKKGGKQSPQSHLGIGPARAVFPAIANTKIQPTPQDFAWKGGQPKPLSVGKVGQSMKHRTACFVAGATTPDAIQIGVAKPASHVAVRPQHGDRITVRYEIPSFKGRQQLVGHVGFMGATIAKDKFDVEMACTLVGKGKMYAYPIWKGKVTTNGSLAFVRQLLDAADLGVAMTKAEVHVTFQNGGALDPICVPGVYGLRLFPVKGTADKAKTVNADLVIDPSATWLVPGDLRDGSQGGAAKQPCLAIRNNGPDAVPAHLLREVKVAAKYYLGQCGTAWSATYGQEVTLQPVRVTDLRELSSKGSWKGSLPKGGVLRLVPNGPPGHKYLAGDGKLASTLVSKPNQANAWKLFRVWADIKTAGAPALKESNPNNAWTHTYQPALIIGKGPLDYEVLLFQKEGFQGASERYEYDPVTQRQRIVWHLAQMPGKRDMYQKVDSFMLGRFVDLRAAEENHFYTCTRAGNWRLRAQGGTSTAYRDRKVPFIGSLILFPKSADEPIGALFRCHIERWIFKNTIGRKLLNRDMFIPLPEKPSVNVVPVQSLGYGFNDEIELVSAWRTSAMQGKYPVIWVKVTLYEDGNLTGKTRTLDGPFKDPGTSTLSARVYRLKNLAWDGSIGVSVEEEATSLKIELVSGSGK